MTGAGGVADGGVVTDAEVAASREDDEVMYAIQAFSRDHAARTGHGVSYTDIVGVCEECEWRVP
jgi:hypothetical protein